MLFKFYCLSFLSLIASCCGRQLKVMTWNILAPMWVDREALSNEGKIDINLLNENIRLWRIVQEIRSIKPDIVALQEVQEDVFYELRKELGKDYNSTGFAANQNHYWADFLPKGVTYKKNGVATFYNKHKFIEVQSSSFKTSESGSVAQVSVLRLKRRQNHKSNPIIAINCHLETGFTLENVTTRILQGSRVVEEAETVATLYKKEDPVVLIIGDMNSMEPFQGYRNVAQQGYTDAQTKIGDLTACTYFFEPPFITPEGRTVNGGAIDHVFLRTADITEGRARLVSVDIPSVASNAFSEESYVEDISKLLKMKFRQDAIKGAGKKIPYLLKSDIFSSLYNAVHESEKKEYYINRVLRRGSDHLHVMARIQIRDKLN